MNQRFDCVLPPDARAELTRSWKTSRESVPLGVALLAVSAAILAATGVILWQTQTAGHPKANLPKLSPSQLIAE
jgi:hypothetical protein